MSESSPPTEYRGPEIPTPLGDQLQLALGLEDRPETFGDWVTALAFLAERDDINVGLNTLCTVETSPHRATFDGRVQHYQCVLDALIVPFLADDIGVVEIETESPVSGESIELTVTETKVISDPSGVVMSFGVAEDIDGPPDDLPSPILAYSRFCPYGHVFSTTEEYQTWEANVDAITMATSLDDALELAQALGRIG